MTYTRANENQIRRMILDICQDHLRKILEAVRILSKMMFDFTNAANLSVLEKHLVTIKKLKEEAGEQKRTLLNELAEVGMLLMNREDFLRFAVQVNEIAHLCEGAAYRIIGIKKRDIKIKNDLLESLYNLSKNVLKTVLNLRETILSLTYSRSKAIEMAKNVEIAKYVVDEMFRNIEAKIIDAELNLGATLLLRDLAQFLEDIADKAEDAIDSIRVLALGT